MNLNDNKVTSFSSITLLLLKELRLERNVHQAQVAEICGKTPSAWTKIETGKNPLTMEIFFRVCTALSVAPSAVLATMERYAALMSQNGWGVLSQQLSFEEDLLLQEAQNYYLTPGFRNRIQPQSWNFNISVLNGPIYNLDGTINVVDVFRYTLDEQFQIQQKEFKPTHGF
ncbi:Helix-turn-helix domain protein [Photobacterium piscicola]|uniref:Helix-turn-helix domain protein n=1 Tax=Photobacterium piscicola TaxID=1378299 RepID=A0A1T5I672_9GAMM|nr:helix-turn-helix transcriptional regulator [Photobacterium piscicola]SKC34433.1 Helix-turn-helix domain protein [Photobacterium piscicola]